MRVLVLSHFPLLADGVASALQERFGFQALPTYSPVEALEAAFMFNFDVAVVDWERADTGKESDALGNTSDALEIGKRIHQLQPRCKLVFYREQIPEHPGGTRGFSFDSLSVTDNYETLYGMIRKTENQPAPVPS
jgi:DNA-binding NarL/FixJ family response regulator